MALSSKKSSAPAGRGTIRAAIGAGLVVGVMLATDATAVAGGLGAIGIHPFAAATLAVLAWVVPAVAGLVLMAPLVARLLGWRA
jgi:hypothetical protein